MSCKRLLSTIKHRLLVNLCVVARSEAIRMLSAFASFMHIKLYQNDAKSVFLNRFRIEEVYIDLSILKPENFLIMLLNWIKLLMN